MSRGRRKWRHPGVVVLVLVHLVLLQVLVLRALGGMESYELLMYDQYLRLRSLVSASAPEFVVIGLNEADEALFDEGPFNPTYSDDAAPTPLPVKDHILAVVLERLAAGNPAAIGLDLIRDRPVPPGYGELEQVLRDDPRIIGIMSFRTEATPGFAAPPAILEPSRVGFADLPPDRDGVVRRGLLFAGDGETTHWSLAMRLVDRYLRLHLGAPGDEAAWRRLGETLSPRLEAYDGGYAGVDAGGYQLLLTYPACASPPPIVSFGQVLAEAPGQIDVEGKLVLVGNMHRLAKDFFQAPVSCQTPGERALFGTALQGQIASQLIRQALGHERPLRTTGQMLGDARLGLLADSFWIWLCIGACGLAVLRLRGRAVLFAASGLGLLLVAITTMAFVGFGWWLPVVPPALGGVAALTVGFAYSVVWERAERGSLMQLFSVYLERSVAESLWGQRDAFTEDGRPVPQTLTATVLFTDIADFTTVSEKMPPAVLMAWLNEYMGAMVAVVGERGGVIDKFIGDAIMALFGVPIPRRSEGEIAQDARMAVDTALAMRQQLERLNPSWRARGLPAVRMRVGIHTGELVAGSLGGSARLQYTVIGDTVNAASRLESYGKGDPEVNRPDDLCRVLVSEATRRHLGDRYEITRVAKPIQVKGRAEEIVVYRIEGTAGQASTSEPADQQQGSDSMLEHSGAWQRRAAGAVLALVWGWAATDGGASAQESASPQPPMFIPSDIGAPDTRIVAGVRSGQHVGDAGEVPLVLASGDTGLTHQAQPTLYWYLPAHSHAALEVTISEDRPTGTGEPLLELMNEAMPAPGVHAIDLGAHGKTLEPDRLYRWHVSAVVDPENRSLDVGSSGTIMRVPPDADLLAKFEGAPVLQQAETLAQQGYWYDVIDLLSEQIAARDRSQPWQELRAGLLAQVGLDEVAAFDHASGGDGQ